MSQTAVLVWLSAASVLPTFRADLDHFAQSRLLRLEAPQKNAAPFRGGTAYGPDAVAQIEALLEEARNDTASLEQSRALAALEQAERLLREHPELPQSAWLMAERLELGADVESTAPDGAGAALALRARAATLAGMRAAPFTDHPESHELAAPALRAITAEGPEPNDLLEWDGTRRDRELSTAVGEHHVRVSRNDRLLWAGWVVLAEDEARVHLPVPATPACSPDDIGGGRIEGGRARAAAHARCDNYVLARGAAGGGIDAALCNREACGELVHYRYVVDASHRAERGWPRWATYTAIAAGVVTTGLVLWRAGVFDRPAVHDTPTLIYMGQDKPMGFRF